MDLKNANIVLTGASSGIGLDTLKRLIDEGANVLAVSRTVESLDFTHERLHKYNADMQYDEQVDGVFNHAIEIFGKIDVFIANAGFTYFECLKKADMNHIEKIIKVNTESVMYQAVKMKELYQDEPFKFLATLSAVSYLSMPGYALYSASKAALRGFFDAYRLEMNEGQILQTIYPVATETEFFQRADQPYKPWPVQSSEHVSKCLVKGLKKDKKHIYPSKLCKYGFKLTPFFFKLYIKQEQKKFNKVMKGCSE